MATTVRTAEPLRTALRGPVYDHDSPEYDEARSLYNGMIDRRPALIARCRDVADVRASVEFGRREGIELAVRGGGHNGAGHRDANWSMVIVGVDPEPASAGLVRDWAVSYSDALHPYSMGGAYVNFMMEEGQERVRATYRGNHDRLAQVKATYDPDNLFHVNQNIRPAR